jgi:hypothetical protein
MANMTAQVVDAFLLGYVVGMLVAIMIAIHANRRVR